MRASGIGPFANEAESDNFGCLDKSICRCRSCRMFDVAMIDDPAVAAAAPDPERARDRLSARWLLALAVQLVGDVRALVTGAARANRPVVTFAIEGEVRLASAADRAAFAEELARAVGTLVGRYHDMGAAGGRTHRIVIAVHPAVPARAPETKES